MVSQIIKPTNINFYIEHLSYNLTAFISSYFTSFFLQVFNYKVQSSEKEKKIKRSLSAISKPFKLCKQALRNNFYFSPLKEKLCEPYNKYY